MSIQIKTTEGVLTLSNASDVRDTGILVVRGHKGVTLGFIAPTAKGWIGCETIEDLGEALDLPGTYHDQAGTLEQAAAHLATFAAR